MDIYQDTFSTDIVSEQAKKNIAHSARVNMITDKNVRELFINTFGKDSYDKQVELLFNTIFINLIDHSITNMNLFINICDSKEVYIKLTNR